MKSYSISERIALENSLMKYFGFTLEETRLISKAVSRKVMNLNGAVAPMRRVG